MNNFKRSRECDVTFKEKRPPLLNLHRMDASDSTSQKSLKAIKSDLNTALTRGGARSVTSKASARWASITNILDNIDKAGKETTLLDNLDLKAAMKEEEKKEKKGRRSPESRRLKNMFNKFFNITPERRKKESVRKI